jgi:hypothetical protein
VSAQIRRELKLKEDENKIRLYKHYIPFIVNAISESIKIDSKRLSNAFQNMAEKYVSGELTNITKQIFQNSDQNKNEEKIKKTSVSNGEDANKLSKFDTRTNILKSSNKIKLTKAEVPRKVTKK